MTHSLVLIGGLGFVGRNILDALAADPAFAGMTPFVVDDLSNACPGHEALAVARHVGPYQDAAALAAIDAAAPGPRSFVFLAGETRVAESKDRPLDFIAANISEPAKFVMEAVRKGDHFILISTAGALFDGTFEVTVDAPYCPKNFYGASKAAEEMVLEKLVELRGGRFSVVRLTNVFGVHSDRKKSAIHAFTRAAIEGSAVTINGDGQQSRDFVFSRDVGRGIATQANRARLGQPVNRVNMLGSGVSTTLWDVVHAIEAATGRPLRYTQIAAEDLIRTEPRDVIASPRDVAVLLGDAITPFAEGIRATHDYYHAAA
ncbi:NAD-dependent epimerase/dehydratase family protein [Paracoccus spongiarum]|uniref:NAD(P)-dependent oxidoreductase n=1 Tax=Paracoccus spongiarum TaxID=3064387 RepID=A0ABT9JEQ4_9RHOB|nr:NAD(P)-dependent oxidoreductase [Paracoccus sp. 2205BS29-5]MDP5307546.1 NAD(P)-dependent oxidoreductase [Paracoccus sp. 2205BS29-5]